ncbi:VOC family protein [Amycolatopsis cihanbeyliensis]|uniref:Glyoxalase-like protein n=1 Tax=Amycolatopsis cihanbeyliensis TaxID=1128664 RepID=A0A542DBU9_AMYCI|nr:VOC family protein [Amycolatopsis cihanbeyliensis]TQJ00535.1 glyoxalase-like protein [Amycolatopsis cihanbeyliensis]
MRCSHVLVKVADLHAAVADFRELGFTVDYASAERAARHAHIWFAEGPIIELLTTPPRAELLKWPIELALGRGVGTRMTRWARAGEGFCDVAVVTGGSDLAGPRRRLRDAGVPIGRPVAWKRTRPDGAVTRFRFAYPRNDRLPFLVTPYDPPQHPPEVRHPNGVTSLIRVLLDVGATDRPAFDRVIGDSPDFAVTPGETTRIRAIELAGLTEQLDTRLLHGAAVRPASPTDSRRTS